MEVWPKPFKLKLLLGAETQLPAWRHVKALETCLKLTLSPCVADTKIQTSAAEHVQHPDREGPAFHWSIRVLRIPLSG